MSKQFYFKQFSFAWICNLNAKYCKLKKPQFSSIWPIDRILIRCYHSGPEWAWERWQWRGTLHSLKLQHSWNLIIRLFSVISRGSYWLQRCSRCILQPQLTGQSIFDVRYKKYIHMHIQQKLYICICVCVCVWVEIINFFF